MAVTQGDPAGIGPEAVIRAWGDPQVHACCRPVVVGHPEILRRAVELVGSTAKVQTLDSQEPMSKRCVDPGRLACIPVGGDDQLEAPLATVDPRSGEAAYQCILRAVRGASAGEFDGLVTAPINKAALQTAGHNYPGHTELLAELCGVDDFAMMLYLPPTALPHSPAGLGVVHVTLHCAMREAIDRLTSEAVAAKCRLASAVFERGFGAADARIAVAALNPHAGEAGLFGDEERRIIAPGVEQARQAGVDAVGPLPVDTLMARAAAGEFDAVVAMYHDQGHIAVKLLNMHQAVNVTLGLPIIRTSVAHGTAFDRAWQGEANASGMVAAIKTAAALAERGFRYEK